jgi:general secretion pathway protein L
MPNHTLALDVGPRTLRAALVERSLRSQRVLGLYAHPRASGGDLAADLRALAVQHGIAWDEVVSVLPGDAVTHRILALPFSDRKRLEQTVPFELESHLPFELDETVIDFQVLDTGADGTSSVLAVSAPKAVVREHLAALAAAGIDPRLVDLGSLAALNVVRDAAAARGGRIAFVGLDADRTTVALLSDGRLTGLRVVSAGVTNGDAERCLREVRWTLLALADGEPLTTLWVGGEAVETPGTVAALGRALGTTPQPLDGVALSAVPIPLRGKQAAFATPLGLALRQTGDGAPFGVDLRRGEFAYHREREALWRGLARAAVLAAVALALMIGSFVVDARQLAARRDAVRADVRTIFTSALPGVRTIVNEKAQLQSEIAALEKQRRLFGSLAPSAPRAIDCLRALTAAVPDDVPLDIEELSLDGETLRLRGSTKTYEGVEAVKRGLAARPEFRNVEAKDVRTSVDGQQVDFRLSLDVGGEPPA